METYKNLSKVPSYSDFFLPFHPDLTDTSKLKIAIDRGDIDLKQFSIERLKN